MHASPGLGKTFLLKELLKKDGGVNYEIRDAANACMFLPLDFNRNSCDEVKLDFLLLKHVSSLIDLLSVARIYYLQFIDQKSLSWGNFFSLIRLKILDKPSVEQMFFVAHCIKLMRADIQQRAAGRKLVVVVDELSKTADFEKGCPSEFRRMLCHWADMYENCHAVVFSTLSQDLMKAETSASQRRMLALTKLPLFDIEHSKEFLKLALIIPTVSFVSETSVPYDSNLAIEYLAIASRGHPRTLQHIAQTCNGMLPHRSINIVTALEIAGGELSCNYSQDTHIWLSLLKVCLLGKRISVSAELEYGERDEMGKYKKEKYKRLVERGMLIDSFGELTTDFIPKLPISYLYWWCSNGGNQSEEDGSQAMAKAKIYLRKILDAQMGFTRKRWEVFQCNWHSLMFEIRSHTEPRLRLPIYGMYQLESHHLPNHCSKTFFLDIDENVVLNHRKYCKNTKLELVPHVAYHPEDDYQPGWDALLSLLLSPQLEPKSNNKKYLLPVFEQHKFSEQGASTILSRAVIMNSYQNCRNFFLNQMKPAEGFHWLPPQFAWSSRFPFIKYREHIDPFLVVFICRMDVAPSAFEDLPSNILILGLDDLEKVYGPRITSIADNLKPDRDDSIE